jgi:hypothetical protein
MHDLGEGEWGARGERGGCGFSVWGNDLSMVTKMWCHPEDGAQTILDRQWLD